MLERRARAWRRAEHKEAALQLKHEAPAVYRWDAQTGVLQAHTSIGAWDAATGTRRRDLVEDQDDEE